MIHIFNSDNYRYIICLISQNPRNDRKIKSSQVSVFAMYNTQHTSRTSSKDIFMKHGANIKRYHMMCREQEL